jgi:hypothetical protein
VPVPVRLIICGEAVALSVTLIDADSAPNTAGLKVTVMTQSAPGATAVAQVFVCVKEAGLVPAMAIAEIASGALPESVTVTCCVATAVPMGLLPKVSEVAESVAAGAAPVG